MLAGLAVLLWTGCEFGTPETGEDRLLARVHQRYLHLSDLEGMVPEGSSSEDSALIVRAYVERWVRNAVVMQEAEKNLPPDLDVDEMVRDYRSSLVQQNYQKKLLASELDSVITREELNAFYEQNRDQYQLDVPVARVLYLKVPLKAPRQRALRNWWNSNDPTDREELRRYAGTYAATAMLSDSTWYKTTELAEVMPRGAINPNNIEAKREFTQRDDNFLYFFRLLEVVQRREPAPQGYVEEQARKFILHQRKKKILEEMTQTIYERALREKDVEVY